LEVGRSVISAKAGIQSTVVQAVSWTRGGQWTTLRCCAVQRTIPASAERRASFSPMGAVGHLRAVQTVHFGIAIDRRTHDDVRVH
jgi:hypothetical protein